MYEIKDTKLTAIQESVALAIATGMANITEIAKKYNISRQTIYDWKKKPEFNAAVDRFRQENLEVGMALINGYFVDAVSELKLLANRTDNDSLRADIYKFIINHTKGKPSSSINVTNKQENIRVIDTDLDEEIDKYLNGYDGEDE